MDQKTINTISYCFMDQKTINTQKLKTMDTIGNCQRLAFIDGVSQHMHKITNL